MPVFSIIFGNVVDALGEPGGLARVPSAAAALLCVGAVAAAAAALEGASFGAVAARTAARLRVAYLRAALLAGAGFHDGGPSHSDHARSLADDADAAARGAWRDAAPVAVGNGAKCVAGLAIGEGEGRE